MEVADGSFVYTGLKDIWLMTKNQIVQDHWKIVDNAKRMHLMMVL